MHAGGVVRLVHVSAAVVLIVGATAAVGRPALLRRYEWIFWSALLVLAITGVGNLAAVGIPPGVWRERFWWKLGAISMLLLFSAVRLLLLSLGSDGGLLRVASFATLVIAAVVAGLGLGVAHG